MPSRSAASGKAARQAPRAGAALRQLVDLVAHRSGLVLSAMTEAGVTLPQVLLLSRVEQQGAVSLSWLAENMRSSAPAVSQMVDRLVQQGFLERTEDPLDRRRKSLRASAAA